MFPLLLVLAAAPSVEVVVLLPETKLTLDDVQQRRPGVQLIDASAVFHAIYLEGISEPRGSKPGNFEAFTMPPPKGWPPTLEATWKAGVGACLKAFGPPPWHGHDLDAYGCSISLSSPLWQAALDVWKPTFVTFAEKNTRMTEPVVRVERFAPRSERMKEVVRPLPDASAARAQALIALDSALAGEGRDMLRTISGPVPLVVAAPPPVGTLKLANAGKATDPLPLATCKGLPGSLSFPKSAPPFAAELARRWANSTKGKGTLACTLSQTTEFDEENAIPFEVVQLKLEGGRASVQFSSSLDPPPQSEALVRALLLPLSKQLCDPVR